MESTGARNRIHISQKTADLLIEGGKGRWVQRREDMVEAKGKGTMQTYWCEPVMEQSTVGSDFGTVITAFDNEGSTFSISNGGVFGSMLSTPIINPPQSAILGVHATKERAVVENGQVVVRPMNYLALSYDHRIIDGREAVLFLVAIKDALEDPSRLLLDL